MSFGSARPLSSALSDAAKYVKIGAVAGSKQPRVGVSARDDRDIFLVDADTRQRFGGLGGHGRRGKQRERNRM
jgi:hypothetical protein